MLVGWSRRILPEYPYLKLGYHSLMAIGHEWGRIRLHKEQFVTAAVYEQQLALANVIANTKARLRR